MQVNRLVLTALDSPRRDFEWRLFLANKLAEAGVSTAIGAKPAIRDIQSRSQNAIILGRLGSAGNRSKGDIAWVNTFDPNGTRWLYFHDEGGLYAKGHYADGAARAYPEPFFGEVYMSRILFWGARQSNIFSPHLAESKFRVTGAPRFDLMRPKYDHLDEREKSKFREKFGSYTLICSRFASANKVEDDAHPLSGRIRELAVESGSFSDREDDRLIRRQFEGWRKVAHEFADFLPAVAELALTYPTQFFVIRPHPAEKSSIYETAFGSFNNIRVEKGGDVRPLIRGADCVIHSECTTGLEAAINQKPVINFRPWRGSEEFEVAGVSDIGAVCYDTEGLISRYQEVLTAKSTAAIEDLVSMQNIVANAPADSMEATQMVMDSILEVSSGMDSGTTLQEPGIGRLARRYAGTLRRSLKGVIGKSATKDADRPASRVDTKAYHYSAEAIAELWAAFGGNGELRVKNGVVWVLAE